MRKEYILSGVFITDNNIEDFLNNPASRLTDGLSRGVFDIQLELYDSCMAIGGFGYFEEEEDDNEDGFYLNDIDGVFIMDRDLPSVLLALKPLFSKHTCLVEKTEEGRKFSVFKLDLKTNTIIEEQLGYTEYNGKLREEENKIQCYYIEYVKLEGRRELEEFRYLIDVFMFLVAPSYTGGEDTPLDREQAMSLFGKYLKSKKEAKRIFRAVDNVIMLS